MKLFVFCLFIFGNSLVFSQTRVLPSYYRQSLNIDSIVSCTPDGLIFYPEIKVYPRKVFSNNREKRRFDRLANNFRRVYPYAIEISRTYKNIEDSISLFTSKDARKQYLKLREKQIMQQYRPVLVKFTMSQGVLLVKLLDREAGKTAYVVLEELKGSVKAFFWQGLAVLFGNNLKAEYDANKEKDIEYLIKLYNDNSL